jgi:hypothetical protein
VAALLKVNITRNRNIIGHTSFELTDRKTHHCIWNGVSNASWTIFVTTSAIFLNMSTAMSKFNAVPLRTLLIAIVFGRLTPKITTPLGWCHFLSTIEEL